MEHRTTRPHASLRACRLRRYVAPFAVLAWLAGGPAAAQTGTAQVDQVIDGDAIRVRLDGARYTVRFTGVDTPETTHPTRGVESYGPEMTTSSQADQDAGAAGSRAVAAGVQPRDGRRPAAGQRAESVSRRRAEAIGKATNGVRGGVWVPIAGAVS